MTPRGATVGPYVLPTQPAAPPRSRNPLVDPEPWDRIWPGPALVEHWHALRWTRPTVLEVVSRCGGGPGLAPGVVVVEAGDPTVPLRIPLETWRRVVAGSWA